MQSWQDTIIFGFHTHDTEAGEQFALGYAQFMAYFQNIN